MPSVNASSHLPRNEESISQSFSDYNNPNIAKLFLNSELQLMFLKEDDHQAMSEIDYQKVPSVAGLKYRGHFHEMTKNDTESILKMSQVAKRK